MGLVERANGELETSLLPGRMVSDPADCNAQLGDWRRLANHLTAARSAAPC